MFHNGTWGTVCHDDWDLKDAHVVCRSLGFGGAQNTFSVGEFGQGTGTILLDNVRCVGHESTIFSCSHNGIGEHNCDHSKDTAVICQGEKQNKFPR